jgi:hypothetical protein
VIAYGCLIRREGARREHLDYIYRGLMSQHPHFTATLAELVMFAVGLEMLTGGAVPSKMYNWPDGMLSNALIGVCKFLERTWDFVEIFHRRGR